MLDHLEKECGGHGNGLALVKKGKITFIKKGVDFKNKSIAKKLLSSDFDYAFYHTRVASVSSIGDENCHPYWDRKKTSFLMMNGTETQYGALAATLGITDTELIFRNIADYGADIKGLTKLTSRFMGMKDKKVYISNSAYSGLKFIRDKNAFVVASSFPAFVRCQEMAVGLWQQGEAIKEKVYTTSYGYDNYNYNNSYKGKTYSGSAAWEKVKNESKASHYPYKSAKDKEMQELRAITSKGSEYGFEEEKYSNDQLTDWEKGQLSII